MGGGVGKREGKALFFPFEVGKMPGRPFRTKKSVSTNLSSIEERGRGHFFLLSMFLFKLPFYLNHVIIAGLPRARSARGTEPHTHGIWSTSFRLVVT